MGLEHINQEPPVINVVQHLIQQKELQFVRNVQVELMVLMFLDQPQLIFAFHVKMAILQQLDQYHVVFAHKIHILKEITQNVFLVPKVMNQKKDLLLVLHAPI